MTAVVTTTHLDMLEEDLENPDEVPVTPDEVRLLIQTIRLQRKALEECRSQANVLWDSGYRAARLEAEGPGPAPLWIQCLRATATSRVCELVNDVLSGRR